MQKTDELGHAPTTDDLNLAQYAKRRLLKAARHLQWDGQSLLILCYHGVSKSDEHVWNPRLYISAQEFRNRLASIRDFGYQVLPLAGALQRMRDNSLKAPTAVITFDDGWHDFHQVAWPILREFDYPATVYQTTYYSKYSRPVFDPACSYLLWKGAGRVIRYRGMNGAPAELDLTQSGAVEEARKDLVNRAEERNLSAEQKDLFLQRLAAAVGVEYNSLLESRTLHLMNAAEVREVAHAGIDIQLHTHRHRLPAKKRIFFQELDENREWIESITQKKADDFCYPNGAHRPELVGWLREAGVTSATTCDPGRASLKSNPLLLPRLTDSACVSRFKFESWLSGVGLIAPLCKRVLRSVFTQQSPSHVTAAGALASATRQVSGASVSTKAAKTSA